MAAACFATTARASAAGAGFRWCCVVLCGAPKGGVNGFAEAWEQAHAPVQGGGKYE